MECSEEKERLIVTFLELTGQTDFQRAKQILEKHGWDIESATNAALESTHDSLHPDLAFRTGLIVCSFSLDLNRL